VTPFSLFEAMPCSAGQQGMCFDQWMFLVIFVFGVLLRRVDKNLVPRENGCDARFFLISLIAAGGEQSICLELPKLNFFEPEKTRLTDQ
jgi:hypothetical protein